MSTPAAGIPSGEGQPQPGNPQPTGQPQGQQTPPPTPPANQPGEPQPNLPDNPQLAELQQKLAKVEEDARKAQESARFYQGNYDRAQQQLKAVVGAQPQADPLAEDIKFFVTQGYNEQDARALVEFTNRKVSGLQQQNQNLQNSLQASSMIGQILQSAAQDKDYIPLFNDPDIAFSVNQELQRVALLPGQKDANQLVEYAKAFAETVYTTKHRPWLQPNQPPQQPQPSQQRPFLGFNGNLQPGYTPVAQQQKASDPTVDALALKMAQHTGLKL
jgi:hypothetical protein